jgi:hypothetical protein
VGSIETIFIGSVPSVQTLLVWPYFIIFSPAAASGGGIWESNPMNDLFPPMGVIKECLAEMARSIFLYDGTKPSAV